MKSMNNDRGFTLIELIVVMVIMAILGVGSIAGYNLLSTSSTEKTAVRVMEVLDYIQMENMTKSKAYTMKITENATGTYKLDILSTTTVGTTQTESTETLELEDGEITYRNDINETYLVSSVPVIGWLVKNELVIGFRKDTGGVKEYDGRFVTRIGITASGRSYYIRLVPATGKHYIE